MDNSLTKSEIIESLAKNQDHLAHKDVELAVKGLLSMMSEGLASGDRIDIRGLGVSVFTSVRPVLAETPSQAMHWDCLVSSYRTSNLVKNCGSGSTWTVGRLATPSPNQRHFKQRVLHLVCLQRIKFQGSSGHNKNSGKTANRYGYTARSTFFTLTSIGSAFCAAYCNAFAERFVRSVKEECLGRVILFGPESLRRVFREYLLHYHTERNHQGVGNQLLKPLVNISSANDPIHCRERLGGMLNYYHREAA